MDVLKKTSVMIADTQAIKETMQGLATKSFALYAAEKGINSNSKKEEEA
jgi:hypothetical protein